MAIAYDAVSNGKAVGATSLTFSHTCSGSNRVLTVIVGISYNVSAIITGVTYNGVAMTKSVYEDDEGYCSVSIWTLIAPATGAHNIVVSTNSSDTIHACGLSLTGCAQSGIVDSTGKSYRNAATNAWSVSTTTTVANSIVICGSMHAVSNALSTPTFSAGATEGSHSVLDADNRNAYSAYYPTTTAGTVTITETNSGAYNFSPISMCALGIKALASVNYTLTASVRSFTLTGIAIALKKLWKMTVIVSSFALSGINILIRKMLNIIVSTSDFVLSGIDATFSKGKLLIVSAGEFLATGFDSNIFRPIINLFVDTSDFVITEIGAGIYKGIGFLATTANYTITGINILFRILHNIVLEVVHGVFSIDGFGSLLYISKKLLTSSVNFVLTRKNINLLRPIRMMAVSVSNYLISGFSSSFRGVGDWVWTHRTKPNTSWVGRTKPTTNWTKRR